MSDPMEFLLWTRGPAFDFAIVIFVLGVLLRFLEIFLLGRKPNYAEPRGGEWVPGLRTTLTRSVADTGTFRRSAFNVIVGWIWHVGFLITLFLFIPHIELFGKVLGFTWAGFPTRS